MPVSFDPDRLRLTNAAGTEGLLLGRHCQDCDAYIFGSTVFCPQCTSDHLESIDFSRHGTLYSYTVVRVPPVGWPGPVPYVLGQVTLPEGPHVMAEIIACDAASLAIGMPVELAIQLAVDEDSNTTHAVYKWRPCDAI